MRAILLPAVGDPVLVKLWIALYEKNIKNSVTNLYVIVNSAMPKEVRKYSAALFEKHNSVVLEESQMIGHGKAIERLFFDFVIEPNIMLIEDDCFVFDSEIVDRCFRGLEKGEYDIAGSPRMSCSTEIADAAKNKWGLDYSRLGDKGPNFWPNCFFITRDLLERTDCNFSNHSWDEGEYIPYLDHTMEKEGAGDTMVHLSLQLRSLNPRIKEIPQYHGSPNDLKNYKEGTGLWDGYAPWVHTGSSSDVQKHFYEKNIPVANTEMEKLEIERRYAWWLLAYNMFSKEIEDIVVRKYVEDCRKYVDEVIMKTGLSFANMKKLEEGYLKLLKL